MDQKPHRSSSDKDLGLTIAFIVVLISAFLLARYDIPGWLPYLLQSNNQQVERSPIPLDPPL